MCLVEVAHVAEDSAEIPREPRRVDVFADLLGDPFGQTAADFRFHDGFPQYPDEFARDQGSCAAGSAAEIAPGRTCGRSRFSRRSSQRPNQVSVEQMTK